MNLIVLVVIALFLLIAAQPMRMSALGANVERNRFVDQSIRAFPVAAATHIFKGGAVGINSIGYLVPYVPSTLFVGLAYEEKDNSAGLAGAATCRVEIGDFVLPISEFAQADIGKPVYATTDNDFSLNPGTGGIIGHAIGYHASGYANVRVEPQFKQVGGLVATIVEVDCQTGETPDEAVLMPAILNKAGAFIVGAWGIVTEVFAGAAQDQGIVALQDSAGTALNITFTATDAGADAVNDGLQEGGTNDTLIGAASGDAVAFVASGKGIKAKVTQPTSGAGAAGKMKIAILVILA